MINYTKLNKDGVIIVKDFFPIRLINELNNSYEDVQNKYCSIYPMSLKKNFREFGNMIRAPLHINSHYLKIYNKSLEQLVRSIIPNPILHLQNMVITKNNSNKTLFSIPHRDIYIFSEIKTISFNVLIPLTDINKSNGATIFYKGTHKNFSIKPSKKNLYQPSLKKGSIIIFISSILHSSGNNVSSNDKVILNNQFTYANVKQQLDFKTITKKLKLSRFQKQLFGYNSVVPNSVDEFYFSSNKRSFKKGQSW